MASELLRYLSALTLASSIAIVCVLTIRRALRGLVGAAAAYSTWLLIPISLLAVWVPHTSQPGSALALTLELDSTSALTDALERGLGSVVRTVPSFQWPILVLASWSVGAALL